MTHTSLAEIIDAAVCATSELDDSAHDRASAAVGLGYIGSAFATLRADGVSRAVGEDRQRHVHQLATVCIELGESAPVAETRATRLAGACADAAATLGGQHGLEQRWAIAVALTDLVDPLAGAIAGSVAAGMAGRRAKTIARLSRRVQQDAALNPPSAAGNTLLDRPIPAARPVVATSANPAGRLAASVAALIHSTGRRDVVLSVAEVLAISLAAEALTRAAADHIPEVARRGPRGAADGWAAIGVSLAPFNDGSRHWHSDLPAHIEAARAIYGSVREPHPPDLAAAIADAVQHVPALADHLHRSVAAWPERHMVLAAARSLPFRESRLAQHLATTPPVGPLVRVDAGDLISVRSALESARDLSAALAAEVGRQRTPTARRTRAAHQAFTAQPDAAARLRTAQTSTDRYLQQRNASPARTARTR